MESISSIPLQQWTGGPYTITVKLWHLSLLTLSLIRVLLIGLCAAGSAVAAPHNEESRFGVSLADTNQVSNAYLEQVKKVGLSMVRPVDVIVEDWKRQGGICKNCESLNDSGLQKLLIVRNSGRTTDRKTHAASMPPRDMFSYRQASAEILMAYQPTVVMVEHEIDSAQSYFDGTRVGVWDSPDDEQDTVARYSEALNAICEVAKKLNRRCASGAISAYGASLLVWSNFIKTGRSLEACDFAQRAFLHSNRSDPERLCKTKSLDGIPPEERKQIAALKHLADALKLSKADFQGLAWAGKDPTVLEQSVQHLRGVIGKPLILSQLEIQEKGEASAVVEQFLTVLDKLRLPFVVFTNSPAHQGGAALLLAADGSPLAPGVFLQNWISKKKPKL